MSTTPNAEPKILSPELAEAIIARAKKIPAFDEFGIRIETMEMGRCVAVVPRNKNHDGIFESFHGGLLMAAADTIACFAIMTHTGADGRMATTDMNIRFLAPCLTDVRVDARVIKAGRTLCPVHVDLYDMENRHVAVAQVNYIRL